MKNISFVQNRNGTPGNFLFTFQIRSFVEWNSRNMYFEKWVKYISWKNCSEQKHKYFNFLVFGVLRYLQLCFHAMPFHSYHGAFHSKINLHAHCSFCLEVFLYFWKIREACTNSLKRHRFDFSFLTYYLETPVIPLDSQMCLWQRNGFNLKSVNWVSPCHTHFHSHNHLEWHFMN